MLFLQMDDAELDEALDAFDRQFDRLTSEANRLAEQYLELGKERKIVLPVVITVVEEKRYRSTAIRWTRVSPRSKSSGLPTAKKAIPKGRNTFKYPDSAFKFLEPELRARVILFEEYLEVLRLGLSKNRTAYSHIRNIKTALNKGLAPIQVNT